MAEKSSAAMKNCAESDCTFCTKTLSYSLNLMVEKSSAAMKNCPLQICIAALLFYTLKVSTPPSQ